MTDEDICGLCGNPGADKVPHPVRWPGEQAPGTPYVHADCESEECARAARAFNESHTPAEVNRFLLSA